MEPNDLIKALEIVDLTERLGQDNNVWIEDKQGRHFQDVKDRNVEGKTFSLEEVSDMMDTLENDVIFILPDNDRD